MKTPSNLNIIEELSAESLLMNSYVFSEIRKIRENLSYETGEGQFSFDDYQFKLQKEADRLPRINLMPDIAPGGERHYTVQLIQAMEQVQDSCERLLRRILKFSSRLRNAQSVVKKLHAEFSAWYLLAASAYVKETGLKFPAKQLGIICDSEFTRLMEGIDQSLETWTNALSTVEVQVKQHRKTQQDKFELGKEQVNTQWANHIPTEAVTPRDPANLLDTEPEEDVDEVPTFVSKKQWKDERLQGNLVYDSGTKEEPEEEFDQEITVDPAPKGTFKKGVTGVVRNVLPEFTGEQLAKDFPSFAATLNEPVADTNKPRTIVAPAIPVEEVMQLRGHIDGEVGDPDYPVAVNYEVKWDEIGQSPLSDTTTSEKGPSTPPPDFTNTAVPSKEWLEKMAEAEAELDCGIMACSPEILEASGGDPNNHLAIQDAAFDLMKTVASKQSEVLTPQQVNEVLAKPAPTATPAPSRPRKKLTFLGEDEEI